MRPGLAFAVGALCLPLSAAVGHPAVKEALAADEPATGAALQDAPLVHELGVSLGYQAPLSLDKRVPLGGGAVYTLHYLVSRRSSLGVQLGVRTFPSAPWHVAMGYGLTFTHHIEPHQRDRLPEGFFLRYGLLLQMNVLEKRAGTATGHDTLLAIGYDLPGRGAAPWILLGYHLTQLRAFDSETLWWPYTELAVGLRF